MNKGVSEIFFLHMILCTHSKCDHWSLKKLTNTKSSNGNWLLDIRISLEDFVNAAFIWKFLFSAMRATLTSPYIWIVYVESRAAFVPQAILQPDCLVGNSETWENVSRVVDSAMMFYAVRLFLLLCLTVWKMEMPDVWLSTLKARESFNDVSLFQLALRKSLAR